MTKEDIIDKAIQKAEKNSGELHGWLLGAVFDDLGSLQDFAKALWGDNPQRLLDQYEPLDESGQVSLTAWEYHLQNMVIADDPIAYLGDNL